VDPVIVHGAAAYIHPTKSLNCHLDAPGQELVNAAPHRGAVHAMNAAGELYLNIFDDYDAASKWFRQAARNGSWQAMLNIALQYRLGLGEEPDDIEELKWIDFAVRESGFKTFGMAAVPISPIGLALQGQHCSGGIELSLLVRR
jgi:hypothetical protein